MALIDVNWSPDRKELRQFALLFLVFAEAAGTAIYFFKDWADWIAPTFWIAGVVVGLAGLLLPVLVRPVWVGMMAIALPIGLVVSTVMIVTIYYLVMTPIGWVMRLGGYDPLQRGFDRSAATHWIERKGGVRPADYFKQY